MVLRISLAILLLLVIVAVIAATRPNTFQVQRSIVIDAPPEKVLSFVDDLRKWPLWAPQDKEDITMTRTFSGPDAGAGAASAWTSRGTAGQGYMQIESASSSRVVINVYWEKPFRLRNVNEFALERTGNRTRITWTMRGPNLYPMKLMGLFTNMDAIMGKHFEAGLANLQSVAEH